jgi:PAS domain S-box-containing protein
VARIAVKDDALKRRLRDLGHRPVSLDQVEADVALVHFDEGPVAGATWLRDLAANRMRPVMVICSTPDQVDVALEAGCAEVLRTPISETLLAMRLRTQLNRTLDVTISDAGDLNLLGRLVEASPDPIVAADLKGQVLLFSRSAEELLGYAEDQVVGRMHVGALYAQSGTASEVLRQMRATEGGHVHGLSVGLRSSKGQPIPVRLSAALVRDGLGRPVASLGIFRDDREHTALSQALVETRSALTTSEQRAATLSLVRQEVQDLSEPLTVALGQLQLLEMDPELANSTRDRLARARQALERMLRDARALTDRLQSGT